MSDRHDRMRAVIRRGTEPGGLRIAALELVDADEMGLDLSPESLREVVDRVDAAWSRKTEPPSSAVALSAVLDALGVERSKATR